MTDQQPTARTAADLPKGTRVQGADGRIGTVNGVDVGRVTNTEHVNYGREYIGVGWDADEKCPWGDRSRPFVDELTIVTPAEADVDEIAVSAEADEYVPSSDAAIAAARIALDELKAKGWKSNPVYWVGRLEAALEQTLKAIDKTEGDKAPEVSVDDVTEAARHGETVKLHRAACTSQGDCASHDIKDRRGGRGLELGVIPTCAPGITYGAWSEGAGGFVYSGDCATEVANWAADELRKLAKDDDTDTIQIHAMCPDHDEQPKNGCEECGSEGDDENEAEPSLDDYAKASQIIQGLMPRGRRQ